MDKMKYRVWDKQNNCYFQNTYKAYEGNLEVMNIGMDGSISLYTINGMIHESIFPDRFEVELTSGIPDIHGNIMHKNDIVKSKYPKADVIGVVCMEAGAWCLRDVKRCVLRFLYDDGQHPNEIIGDVHNNPELLERS